MKKILTFIFVSVLFMFIPVFALGNSDNSKISRVYINKLDNNTFTLNVYFDSEYRNKAFIQQLNNGRYVIYLPEASQKVHTPIMYADNSDKNRIKLDIAKRPLVEKDKTSSYTRITVTMNSDYSLKIISKLKNEDRMIMINNYIQNYQNIMLLLVLLFSILMLRKIIRIAKTDDRRNGSVQIPVNTYLPREELKDVPIGDDKLREYVEKKAATSPLKTANRAVFQSFGLNNTEQNQQAANIQRKKIAARNTRQIKQTPQTSKVQQNPIKNRTTTQAQNAKVESKPEQKTPQQKQQIQHKPVMSPKVAPKRISELKVNSINISRNNESQTIKQEVKPVIIEQKKPDILSRINISSGKGLYLAAEGDIISLYGFNAGNSVLLKRFKDLSQLNLQARFFDHSEDGDVYIVRIDSYKSMIAFKDDSVCELVVL